MIMDKRGAMEQSESGVPGWIWTLIVLAVIVAGGLYLFYNVQNKGDVVTQGKEDITANVAACNVACNTPGGEYSFCTNPRTLTFSDGLKSDPISCSGIVQNGGKAIVHPGNDKTKSEARAVPGINPCSITCPPAA